MILLRNLFRSPLFDMMMMVELIKSMFQAITRPIKNLINCYLRYLAGSPSLTDHQHDSKLDHHITLIIEDNNVLYTATQAYLFSKFNIDSAKIHIGEGKVDDLYQGVKLKWRIFIDKKNSRNVTKECFELRFDEKHRDLVFDCWRARRESSRCSHTLTAIWTWVAKSLDHHSTFETIVVKEELKRGLINDFDRFMTRKDFYTRVGRQWVRNYLLHGLPGTGKTSLVAAMAKYLNFDVYSLKLTEVVEAEYDLRRKNLGIMDNSRRGYRLLPRGIDSGIIATVKWPSWVLVAW